MNLTLHCILFNILVLHQDKDGNGHFYIKLKYWEIRILTLIKVIIYRSTDRWTNLNNRKAK